MSVSLLRRHAHSIFRAALTAADPIAAVTRHLKRIHFERFAHIYVLGAGKAGLSMAQAAERIIGRRITAGFINVKDGDLATRRAARPRRIEWNECGHPVPDARGAAGAERIAAIARQAGEKDLVVWLVSGGASALLPYPAAPITLEEKQATTRLLLACGADIHEINTVRKHISQIKGGQLARLAAPAAVEALILSDVIGDDPAVIGSGPTAPDASTFADALAVFDRYAIRNRLPASVRHRLESGAAGEIPETPKPGDSCFRKVRNTVIGSNRLALAAAARRARELGYHTLILASGLQGEAREIARVHAAMAHEIAATGHPLKPPACVISGGEPTVTLHGKGRGGRNQEFALAAAIDIAGLANTVVFSAGTDGTDGPTDAAGAIADGHTLHRNPEARRFLAANDSYNYFQPLGDLVITGPTHTNVMDVQMLLVGSGK
jgi:glycerate 2-kinase